MDGGVPVAAPASPEVDEKVAVGGAAAAAAGIHEEVPAAAALKKGPWATAEDAALLDHVRRHGEGNWNAVRRMTGLMRCGKSCRLRWTNHLRPDLKKGSFSPDEELLIAQLHAQLGNKWARMASHLPGRTDNEIKNYWNTRTKRRQRAGLPVYPPEVHLQLAINKRCRYDDATPLSSSSPQQSGSNILLSLDATSVGYTSGRPPPLNLAMANRPLQFLAPTPFSAPSSPWAATAKPFTRNAHYFQFPHSLPVSPTGAAHHVTPDLSLGYYDLHAGDRTPLQPLSTSTPGARSVELPLGEGVLLDQQNAASLEAMLQELHDAIEIEPAAAAQENGDVGDSPGDQNRLSGSNKSDGEVKDDIDTLLDLMAPMFATDDELGVPPKNISGSISHRSSDGIDHSNVHLGINLPVEAGGTGSSEQDWGLDGGTCQWNNMSSIC